MTQKVRPNENDDKYMCSKSFFKGSLWGQDQNDYINEIEARNRELEEYIASRGHHENCKPDACCCGLYRLV